MKILIDWLLESDEPWTNYRAKRDLLDIPESEPQVQANRAEMLVHPQVQELINKALTWGEQPIRRHNDASHPIYAFSTLADFGLTCNDPPLQPAIDALLAHTSPEGAFQSPVNVPPAFSGDGLDHWTWMLCDAPTLLYSLLAMGMGDHPRVPPALEQLLSLADENGWRCRVAAQLGKFRGPGKRGDPCPIANLYALKAIAQVPTLLDSPAAQVGIEMLLGHWAQRGQVKYYLFGIGTDFRKIKYPYVWYDILHVAEVLSRYPRARRDARFQELLGEIAAQQDAQGRLTAGSMYQAWKGWSFADKKQPSPWLTFLWLRIQRRMTI